MTVQRRTINASDNPAVLGGMKAKNNGRYNGNGREWGTPPEVFGPLHAEFNFTLDACATEDNAKVGHFYTEVDDGLAHDWCHERVFMNPPYGREIYAWTRKARDEAKRGALVVGLLPASCDLKWWHEDVVGHAEVRYIRGRVRFLTDGPYRASGFFASVIVIWHPTQQIQHVDSLGDMCICLECVNDRFWVAGHAVPKLA
jgi:site-specific DNA-methyltransferase (adenine-specific)